MSKTKIYYKAIGNGRCASVCKYPIIKEDKDYVFTDKCTKERKDNVNGFFPSFIRKTKEEAKLALIECYELSLKELKAGIKNIRGL